MMGIGIVPVTLLVGAGAVWLGMPGLLVLVVCALVIALGAFAVSQDSRVFHVALVVVSVALLKFVVFAEPAITTLLRTKYSAFSFMNSDWFIGAIAAVSIPLSSLFGLYGPLQGRYRLNLFGGRAVNFLLTFSAWLAISGALYAYFRGHDVAAATVGVVAAVLFVMSVRARSSPSAHA